MRNLLLIVIAAHVITIRIFAIETTPLLRAKFVGDDLAHGKTILQSYSGYEECPICLEHMTPQNKISIGPCKHQFHTNCIQKWQKNGEGSQQRNCPNCRQPLKRSVLQKIRQILCWCATQDTDS